MFPLAKGTVRILVRVPDVKKYLESIIDYATFYQRMKLRNESDIYSWGDAVAAQQQPLLPVSTLVEFSIFTPACASLATCADGGPTRCMISAAIVMKACSTLDAFFAEVSRNGMPNCLAYSCIACQSNWYKTFYGFCNLNAIL